MCICVFMYVCSCTELQRLAVQTVFSVIHHLEHCHRDAMTLLALAVAKSSSSSRAKASPPKSTFLKLSKGCVAVPSSHIHIKAEHHNCIYSCFFQFMEHLISSHFFLKVTHFETGVGGGPKRGR